MSSAVFQNKVFSAPMAGITDEPMRRIIFETAGNNVSFVSEMVAVNAISYKNAKTYRMAKVGDEPYPVVVQLMGSEPDLFNDAARLVTDLGAAGIDINMGCPVRKIIASGGGAVLMTMPEKAAKIIETVCSATSLPVSVKFRKGWDINHVNAVDFAKMCEKAGASYITIHGRTKAQGYSGSADWDIIRQVKESVKIGVVGNGDVTSPESAKNMIDQTGVDAVMIGRAALGNPWIFKETADFLTNKKALEQNKDVYGVLMRHLQYLNDYYGPKVALGLSRKYVCWYSKNLFDAKKFRDAYMKITHFDKAMSFVETYFNNLTKRELP